jgi:glyceraldehyde 3-phosphate dehydrogenase
MSIRLAINGFGRIGRSVLRALKTRGDWPDIEVMTINDVISEESCGYLFEYDSIYGPYPGKVRLERGVLEVDGQAISLTHEPDISKLDLTGIDVLLECTGRANTIEARERTLAGGARRVLISGPAKAAQFTVVLGANDDQLFRDYLVVSNASCTTNALAPLARHIDEQFGVVTGYMTTIHCYTGSQPTVDAAGADFTRSRAAALSMVPTTTSALRLLDLVLPKLAGRIEGSAVRVPTASVSAVDFSVMTRSVGTVEGVNAVLKSAGGVIGWSDRPLVSVDLRARPESIVMALSETRVTTGGMLRVFGWYDNEWGFSCRMLDIALRMGKLN